MEINDKVLIRSSIDLDDEQYGTVIDFDGNLVQVHFDLSGEIGIYHRGELMVVDGREFDEWASQYVLGE
jgi:hypothetical protein